jgi:hypothetical protein
MVFKIGNRVYEELYAYDLEAKAVKVYACTNITENDHAGHLTITCEQCQMRECPVKGKTQLELNINLAPANYRINYELGGIVYLTLVDKAGKDIVSMEMDSKMAMQMARDLILYAPMNLYG